MSLISLRHPFSSFSGTLHNVYSAAEPQITFCKFKGFVGRTPAEWQHRKNVRHNVARTFWNLKRRGWNSLTEQEQAAWTSYTRELGKFTTRLEYYRNDNERYVYNVQHYNARYLRWLESHVPPPWTKAADRYNYLVREEGRRHSNFLRMQWEGRELRPAPAPGPQPNGDYTFSVDPNAIFSSLKLSPWSMGPTRQWQQFDCHHRSDVPLTNYAPMVDRTLTFSVEVPAGTYPPGGYVTALLLFLTPELIPLDPPSFFRHIPILEA